MYNVWKTFGVEQRFGFNRTNPWQFLLDRLKRGAISFCLAVPLLFAALSLVVASLTSLDVVVLLALSRAVVAIYACYGPFFSLPSMFLSGSAAAVGIAFVNTIANLGAFVGPYLIGVLNERTGNYALSMAVLSGGLVMTSLIILALGQAIAPRERPVPEAAE